MYIHTRNSRLHIKENSIIFNKYLTSRIKFIIEVITLFMRVIDFT